MDFEWDEVKNQKNKNKHGLSFELAEYLFNETMMVKEDNRSDYGETRYIGYGLCLDRCLNVIFTRRNDKIRIISLRKANEREKRKYFETIEKHR